MKMKIDVSCPLCGKSFNDRRNFAFHLSRCHHLDQLCKEKIVVNTIYGENAVNKTVELYVSGKVCCDDLYKGIDGLPDIVQYIKLIGVKRTSSQERKTQRYKEKYLSSIRSKYGESINNISQSNEIQKKKEETFAKTYGSYESYCEQARKKMSIGYKRKYDEDENFRKSIRERIRGDKNPSRRFDVRLHMSKTHSDKWAHLTKEERRQRMKIARSKRKQNGNSSLVEDVVCTFIKEKGIEFERHKKMFGYTWDIVIESNRVIMEVNGDYFHGNPNKYGYDKVLFHGKDGKVRTAGDMWKHDEMKKK